MADEFDHDAWAHDKAVETVDRADWVGVTGEGVVRYAEAYHRAMIVVRAHWEGHHAASQDRGWYDDVVRGFLGRHQILVTRHWAGSQLPSGAEARCEAIWAAIK